MAGWKNLWNRGIWKVPLFCTIAGIISLYAEFYLLQWSLVILPDGSVTTDPVKSALVYGGVFLAAMLLGGLVFFRKMTKREIFCSASVLAVYGIVLVLVQRIFQLTTGPAALWMLNLFYPFQIFSFILQLCFGLIKSVWAATAVQILCPYLFIVFGKRDG